MTKSLYQKKRRPSDLLLKIAINGAALLTVIVLAGIILYILINGLPYISWEFLSTSYSESPSGAKGILPMIINTLYIVAITLLIATPIGISSAIYLTQYAKQGRLVRAIRFTTEILSGIPSILFGLFGYTVFCVMFRMGTSILAGCLTMTLCILPTIVRTTEESLLAVPGSYKEGAMALGAGKLRVIASCLKIITDVERVADQCADICDIIQAGEIPAQSSVVNHVVQMLETAGAMFEKAMDAFIARDVELARQVCGMDDQVDAMFSKIVLEVCGTITENPQSVMKEVDLMFITKYIERMGDHATNIAEWVVYMETGVHPDLNDGRI